MENSDKILALTSLRKKLTDCMESLKKLHDFLLDVDLIMSTSKIKHLLNDTHFQIGYLTGVLQRLDEKLKSETQ